MCAQALQRFAAGRDREGAPDVYNILLHVFDDGRLTDGRAGGGFTNTIIIATSNLGSDIIQRRLKARGAAGEEYEKTKSEVMDVLRGHFRPEFLNRIDEIIVFHALGKEEIRHIVGLQLDRVTRNAARQGVTLTFDQTLIDHFAEAGYKPEFGARELKRLIRSEMETHGARNAGWRIGKDDHASARWDDKAERVVFERQEPPAKPAEPEKPDAANVAEAPPSDASKPARKKKSAAANLERWEAVVSDPNGLTWAATLVSLAVAIPTAGHAVIYKRDPRSASLWVLLIALLPLGVRCCMGCSDQPVTSGGTAAVSGDGILLFGRISPPTVPEPVSPPLAGLAHLVGPRHRPVADSGNRIEPLIDGEQAYPAMLAAIESARYSVALTSYIFDSQASGRSSSMRCAGLMSAALQVRCADRRRVCPLEAPQRLPRLASAPAFRRRRSTPTLIPARLHAAHCAITASCW
jgi:hypothetical protein